MDLFSLYLEVSGVMKLLSNGDGKFDNVGKRVAGFKLRVAKDL